jgi:DNA polymerase-3 subunit delta'
MTNFSELIGQEQAVNLLTNALKCDRIAPAYLLAGPEGVGRSLAARCFIESFFTVKSTKNIDISTLKHRLQQLNHPDLLWVQPTYLHQGKMLSPAAAAAAGVKRKAPPQIRLDQIREISQFLSRAPLEVEKNIVVLEGADTMAEGAANGLLKTLEEPGKATIILIALSVDSLLPTLVSRCQRIPFYRLSEESMKQVLELSGNQQVLSHPEIIAMAQGSPGDAMECWQQLQTIPTDLLAKLKQKPQTLKQALVLAQEITQKLDTEGQLWLVDYLQNSYWQQLPKNQHLSGRKIIEHLEKARRYLLSYVQPRLVWECTLMAIGNF